MISLKKLLSFTLAATLLTGCKAEEPPHVYNDRGVPKDIRPPGPDAPAGCQGRAPLAAPTVDGGNALIATQLSQPIRGFSPNAATIVARSSAGSSQVGVVSSDGRFCIEVDLIADSQNNIILTPYSALGCPGNTVTVSIQHRTSALDAGVPNQPENVAALGLISSDPAPETGSLDSVNDGDQNSWARFSFTDLDPTGSECDNHAQILLDLKKTYVLTRFEIQWGPEIGVDGAEGETYWAECYSILISNADTPAAPNPTHGDWEVVVQESAAVIGKQTHAVDPKSARWVALWLYENGGTDFYTEDFDVAELTVVGQDPNATPPLPPDRCE